MTLEEKFVANQNAAQAARDKENIDLVWKYYCQLTWAYEELLKDMKKVAGLK